MQKITVILYFLSINSSDSSSSLDFKDSKSDIEEETTLCNTVLITGPPGVGKTAAVYACAQELGFKVCGVLSFLSAFFLFIAHDTKASVIQDVYNLIFFLFCKLNSIADI